MITGEFRNWDGENGSDLIGVMPLGLLHFTVLLTVELLTVSWAWADIVLREAT